MILDGAVAVQTPGEAVSRLGAGDAFGEMAPLARTPRRSTVVAIAPTALLVFRRREFAKLLDRAPRVGRALLRAASTRLRSYAGRRRSRSPPDASAGPGRRPTGYILRRMAEEGLLGRLTDEDRRKVLSSTRRRRYTRGEIVFHEGDLGDALHLIAKGHVAVRAHHPARRRLHLHRARARRGVRRGRAPRRPTPAAPARVVALEPVETQTLSGDQFGTLRREHPEIDRFLVEVLSAQVRRLSTPAPGGAVRPGRDAGAAAARRARRLVPLRRRAPS